MPSFAKPAKLGQPFLIGSQPESQSWASPLFGNVSCFHRSAPGRDGSVKKVHARLYNHKVELEIRGQTEVTLIVIAGSERKYHRADDAGAYMNLIL